MSLSSVAFHLSLHRTLRRARSNSVASIEGHRNQSLRRLLSGARQRVPFQRERLVGIDLEDIQLEDIPPTNKSEMMASFNETVADGAVTLNDVLQTDSNPHQLELPIVRGKYIVVKTSGSSGKPSWLVCGMNDWATLLGATYARMAKSLLTPRRLALSLFRPLRTATVAAQHAHSMTWQGAISAGGWAGPFGRSRFFSVIDSVEHIAAGLNEFRPDHLHGYPTAIEMLARYALDGRGTVFEPKLISVGSEALSAIARQTIHQAFPNTELIDHYGMSECLPLSTECQHGCKHINSDYAILEPRDAENRPVEDGSLSDHVLVTNLINRVQPIIRYRVDDSVRISRNRCACGSRFPIVEIVSRKGCVFHLRGDADDWQVFSPPIAVDTMLHVQGISQYQIVHVRQNVLEVRFLARQGADPSYVEQLIRKQFEDVLRRLGCANTVEVRVKHVDTFERTGVGSKVLQMISMVAAPPVVSAREATLEGANSEREHCYSRS